MIFTWLKRMWGFELEESDISISIYILRANAGKMLVSGSQTNMWRKAQKRDWLEVLSALFEEPHGDFG